MDTKTIYYFLFIVVLFSLFSCQKEDLTSEHIPENKDMKQI